MHGNLGADWGLQPTSPRWRHPRLVIGAQRGAFEGRGPIHEKGHNKAFLTKTWPQNTVC